MPAFTADQLAGVFVWRWKVRDMTREFISHLRPRTFVNRFGVDYRSANDGAPIRIRVPGGYSGLVAGGADRVRRGDG